MYVYIYISMMYVIINVLTPHNMIKMIYSNMILIDCSDA